MLGKVANWRWLRWWPLREVLRRQHDGLPEQGFNHSLML
jgi:hypothetical protein